MHDTTPATLPVRRPTFGCLTGSPDTQSEDRVSHRYEHFCSTRRLLRGAGYSAPQPANLLFGKVRAPKPLARHRVPYGALPVYTPPGSDSIAVAPLSSPWLKPGASKDYSW